MSSSTPSAPQPPADAAPTVSIVIGSNAPPAALERCLAALEPQRDGAEVLVCTAVVAPAELRERFSWARFLERSGALVPELWRDGIDAASGDVIALTIAQMAPAEDWVATIRRQLSKHEAVGGAIEPADGLRLSDWAEYFVRYSRDMLPFVCHECTEIPGDNAAYRRSLLDRTTDLFRDGFWEPVVNRRLASDGVVLWHTPALVVRHGRSSGWTAFVRQRLTHGRAYGRQRGAWFTRRRNLVGVVGAPLVVVVMTARLLRDVLTRQRHRREVVAALPVITSFNVAWAIGEARGHVDVLRQR